jgi:hypothetical protein
MRAATNEHRRSDEPAPAPNLEDGFHEQGKRLVDDLAPAEAELDQGGAERERERKADSVGGGALPARRGEAHTRGLAPGARSISWARAYNGGSNHGRP